MQCVVQYSKCSVQCVCVYSMQAELEMDGEGERERERRRAVRSGEARRRVNVLEGRASVLPSG